MGPPSRSSEDSNGSLLGASKANRDDTRRLDSHSEDQHGVLLPGSKRRLTGPSPTVRHRGVAVLRVPRHHVGRLAPPARGRMPSQRQPQERRSALLDAGVPQARIQPRAQLFQCVTMLCRLGEVGVLARVTQHLSVSDSRGLRRQSSSSPDRERPPFPGLFPQALDNLQATTGPLVRPKLLEYVRTSSSQMRRHFRTERRRKR